MSYSSAVILALPDALSSSVTLPLEMLQAAADHQRARRRPVNGDILIAGLSRRAVTMAGGISIKPQCRLDQVRNCRLLIIPGFWRHPERQVRRFPELLHWLQQLHGDGTTICAVGSGSFLLAACGLLDNRAATTHWYYFDAFAARFPSVNLKRDFLLTQSGNIYCAGSVNSVADVIVHLITQTMGEAAARAVENQFSPEVRREFHGRAYREGSGEIHADEVIARLQSWLIRHYARGPDLQQLCEYSGLSPRSLNRRFVAATGSPPIQYVQRLKVNAALELLRDTDLGVSDIAAMTGFGDSSQFCRQFRKHRDQSPSEYRRSVRAKLFSTGPLLSATATA